MSYLPDVEVHAALNARFSGGPTRYLSPSSTQPVMTPSGYTGVTEPVGYGRVAVAPGAWPSASGRAVQATVDLPDVTADLGIFPYWVLWTASSGGAATVAGEFDDPLVLVAGTSNISATVRVESPASFV